MSDRNEGESKHLGVTQLFQQRLMLRNEQSTTPSSTVRAESMLAARREGRISSAVLALAGLELVPTVTNGLSLSEATAGFQALGQRPLKSGMTFLGVGVDRGPLFADLVGRRQPRSADLVAGI